MILIDPFLIWGYIRGGGLLSQVLHIITGWSGNTHTPWRQRCWRRGLDIYISAMSDDYYPWLPASEWKADIRKRRDAE